MVVEPNASGMVSENINPVGRAFTASSIICCLPEALAQKGPHALGNHPGEAAVRAMAEEAGPRTWNLVAEGMTNRVYALKRSRWSSAYGTSSPSQITSSRSGIAKY